MLLALSVTASAAEFPDVPAGSTYAQAVQWVSQQGYINGYNGRFRRVLLTDGKSVLDHIRAGLQFLNGLDGPGEAASIVDVEGDDGLAGKGGLA